MGEHTISRRNFLAGLTATGALAAAGRSPDARRRTTTPKQPPRQTAVASPRPRASKTRGPGSAHMRQFRNWGSSSSTSGKAGSINLLVVNRPQQ